MAFKIKNRIQLLLSFSTLTSSDSGVRPTTERPIDPVFIVCRDAAKKELNRTRLTCVPGLCVATTSLMRRSSDGVTPPTRKRKSTGLSLGCGRLTCS